MALLLDECFFIRLSAENWVMEEGNIWRIYFSDDKREGSNYKK